jgi:serine/threonine protein kinase
VPNIEQASRYHEIRRLGGGGMAGVTLAEDTVLGRPVALKRVYSTGDPRHVERLKREAMVGASLSHPNLVFVYDAQLQDDGDVVIVMEYVEGETLADAIRSRGAMPADEVKRVLRGVAAALDAIHAEGIVHRDVKPANVLLGHDGTVKLADLGIAHVADRTNITTAGAVVGSFSYMAAEQLDGAAPTPAMDVYALGALAFEMLTGRKARPESHPLALAHAVSTQPPPDLQQALPTAPRAAAAVLQQAMSGEPASRPGSAGEFVRRLEAALAPERPPQPTRPPQATRWPQAEQPPQAERRSMLAPALVALAALALTGVLVAVLTAGGKNTGAPVTSTAGHSSSRRLAEGTHSRAAPGTSSTAATSAGAPSSASAGPSSSAPAGAVQQFYTAAASHQYAAAWALADPNLRGELGGYRAFENEMSVVRSITFHSAQVMPGGDANAATVSLKTTSVQTNRTQQCAGTARTVRSSTGGWLLDGISISCD